MKEFNFKDYFKINDSHSQIRGFVILRDSMGNVIFKKENLIVEEGRRLVLDRVYSVSKSYKTGISVYNITFGDGRKPPEPTDEKISGDEKFSLLAADLTTELNESNDISARDSGFFYKITGNITGQSSRISELGLFVGISEDDKKMFSHLIFDPVTLDSAKSYSFEYRIYF